MNVKNSSDRKPNNLLWVLLFVKRYWTDPDDAKFLQRDITVLKESFVSIKPCFFSECSNSKNTF